MPNIQNLERNRFSVAEDWDLLSAMPIEAGIPYILTTSYDPWKKIQPNEKTQGDGELGFEGEQLVEDP